MPFQIRYLDLIVIYRISHLKASEYTFIFQGLMDHYPRNITCYHKTTLSKIKETEITASIFTNHSGMKLEINHKKKATKNMLPNK